MKESLKISKTFVCGCGREYTLELSTDLAVDNLAIEVSCPSCGEKRTISAGSLLTNKASPTSPSQSYSQTSSNSDSVPSLSFMDSMEAQEKPQESSESSGSSSESSSSSSSSSQSDEELGGAYSDMFGDR